MVNSYGFVEYQIHSLACSSLEDPPEKLGGHLVVGDCHQFIFFTSQLVFGAWNERRIQARLGNIDSFRRIATRFAQNLLFNKSS